MVLPCISSAPAVRKEEGKKEKMMSRNNKDAQMKSPNLQIVLMVPLALSTLFLASSNLAKATIAAPQEKDLIISEIKENRVETKTLYVASQQVDCVGVAPQKCLLVKESIDGEYEYFYDSIEGFDWEAGYVYALRVAVTVVQNPPADSSSLHYQLIEIISKQLDQ